MHLVSRLELFLWQIELIYIVAILRISTSCPSETSNKMGSKRDKSSAKYCTGSSSFIPSKALQGHARHEPIIQELRATNDLETAIKTWFSIDEGDDYVYHANTSVTLSQVQGMINRGGEAGLLAWYWTEKGGERQPVCTLPYTP